PTSGEYVLSWEQRVRIALDAAKGLAYLHESNIIHRDFKASNILLAEDYSARLTDFGMARAGPTAGRRTSRRESWARWATSTHYMERAADEEE
ncbi:hypothetical protein CLOM_g17929, partial [Closterium sp. NIES-68]